MPGQILILTATICPPANAPGVARLDPRTRLADYEAALDHYIDLLGGPLDHILFVENSGYDLERLRALVARRSAARAVSFIQTNDNDFPPEYGRCYGEILLLDRAMASDLVARMPADTVFWKATGRYKLMNLPAMVRTRRAGRDLYIDLRNARGTRWADMRIMSWTKAGYDAFLHGIAPLLREDQRGGRPGEEAAYDELTRRVAQSSLPVATCFATEPRIDGVRAFDNQNWSAGRQRLVAALRQGQRTLLGRVLI